MLYLKSLKIKYVYRVLIILLFFFSILRVVIFNNAYRYKNESGFDKGVIVNLVNKGDINILTIKGKINYRAYTNKLDIAIGDVAEFKYVYKDVNAFNIPNTFNYYKYLKGKNINEVVNIERVKKISENKLYKLKDKFYKIVNTRKSKDYLYTFLFCDKSMLEQDVKDSFSNNGIIHLITVSGFHVSFLLLYLKKMLSKIFCNDSLIRTILLLVSMMYLFLSDFSVALLRATLFYFLDDVNKIFNNLLSRKNLFYMTLFISLILFPSYIYLSSFYYTNILAYFLIIKDYKKKSIVRFNLYAFFISLPLTIYFNYKFNLLSILYSFMFSFVICYLLYPLSFLSLMFSFFDRIFYYLTRFINLSVLKLDNIKYLTVIVPKVNVYIIVIIYTLHYLYIDKHKVRYIMYLAIIFFYSYFRVYFDANSYVYFLDVGQGDSILKVSKYHKNITLIDTGGSVYKNTYLYKSLEVFLNSLGVRKLDNLILTHGDYDHMGEAINLVNNFKVKKVIFNCGPYNDLEQELIKVLGKRKIPYYSCIKELNIENNKLYFLQTKEYDNENDNSNVIYTEIGDYRFIFMGDAGVDKEKDIIEKYNISDIDVLKVGHHGSKTSSSMEFINEIDPKYSVISVGKNNRYGHPNKEVLNVLENLKLYRTDKDGTIMFKIKNNKLSLKIMFHTMI